MSYSVRNIAIAVLMAAAAAVAVIVYTSSYRQSVEQGQARVTVLVASRNIPAGTPASAAQGMMAPRSVLTADRAVGALTNLSALGATVATQTIYAGQQVIAASFQPAVTQGPSLQLTKDMRAVQINVNPTSGLLGVLAAGGRVDVFATFHVTATTTSNLTKANERWFTRRLLTNVLVMQVPAPNKTGNGGLGGGAASGGLQVMIAVSQRDAAKLAFAESATNDAVTLWLVVRPPDAQASEDPITIETFESMLADGVSPAELKAKYAQAIKLVTP